MDKKVTSVSVFHNSKLLYNTPVEISARLLVLLHELKEIGADKEKLMYLDHLTLHTNDIGGSSSLHAPVPNRSVQVYAKSELITKSLTLLLSKELIVVRPTSQGFMYFESALSAKFLSYFDSEYYLKLVQRAKWVAGEFGDSSSAEIRELVEKKIEDWSKNPLK